MHGRNSSLDWGSLLDDMGSLAAPAPLSPLGATHLGTSQKRKASTDLVAVYAEARDHDPDAYTPLRASKRKSSLHPSAIAEIDEAVPALWTSYRDDPLSASSSAFPPTPLSSSPSFASWPRHRLRTVSDESDVSPERADFSPTASYGAPPPSPSPGQPSPSQLVAPTRSLSIAVRPGASPALSTVDEGAAGSSSSAEASLDADDGDFAPEDVPVPPSTPSRSRKGKGKGRKAPATPRIRKPRVRPDSYVARPPNAWILYRSGASTLACDRI